LIKYLSKKLQEIRSSEYAKNVATLATGTTIAQLISVGAAPILYRIYSKEDYGTLGVFMAITGVIGVFSTLRYNEAIMIEEDASDAKQVFFLNRIINLIYAVLLLVVIFLLNNRILLWFNISEIGNWLYLTPLVVFFSGNNAILRVWANRYEEFNLLALNTIIISLAIPALSLLFGIFKLFDTGLIISFIIGTIIPYYVLQSSLDKKYKLSIMNQFSLSDLKRMAVKHRNFPKFALIPDVLFTFNNQLPVFYLNNNFDTGVVGLYNLALRMVTLPVQLISSSISEVFRQKATIEYYKYGNCEKLYIKTIKTLFIIGVFPFLFLLVFSPELFAFIFGTQWRESGVFSQILIPMIFGTLVVSPMTYLYNIVNKQKENMIIYIIFFVFNIVLFLYLNFGLRTTLIIFSFSRVLFYFVHLYNTYYYSKGIQTV